MSYKLTHNPNQIIHLSDGAVIPNALNINDWSLLQAKEAYLSAYEILKRFLSVGQISIMDAENINFRLV